MTCPELVESGVYLLGALSPGQRQTYERHLATCAECRAEVSDLAALPGLLGRIDEAALAELSGTIAPPTVLPTVLYKVRRHRRVYRGFAIAGAAAAACLALVAGLLMPPRPTGPTGTLVQPSTSPSATVPALTAMDPVGPPRGLFASIRLTGSDAGTRLDGTCTYSELPGSTGTDGPVNLSLWAVPKTGKAVLLDTWHALPSSKVPLVGMTWWPVDQLTRIEVRMTDGTVVLVYHVT
jgi:hypothetical protein